MESTDENLDGFKEFYETEMEELDLMSLSRYDSAERNIIQNIEKFKIDSQTNANLKYEIIQ